MTHFEAIRPNVMALYFNLSGLLHPEEEIIDAVHDNVGAIRLAVVKVTEKVTFFLYVPFFGYLYCIVPHSNI